MENSCEIGLTINGKFKPFERLSHKQRFRFRSQIKQLGLDKLDYYKQFIK